MKVLNREFDWIDAGMLVVAFVKALIELAAVFSFQLSAWMFHSAIAVQVVVWCVIVVVTITHSFKFNANTARCWSFAGIWLVLLLNTVLFWVLGCPKIASGIGLLQSILFLWILIMSLKLEQQVLLDGR